MKRDILASAVLLLTIVCISASAQTRPTPTATPVPKPAVPQTPTAAPAAPIGVPVTRMAVVDTEMFADEKAGITRFVNAMKSVSLTFQPRTKELTDLQARIKAISDELSKLNSGSAVVGAQTIQAKQEEGERLQRELQYKKEQYDADVAKQYKQVVSPVSAEIGKALDRYATEHGLTMILDLSKLLPAVITVNPAMDITPAFIADFNSKNP